VDLCQLLHEKPTSLTVLQSNR